MGTWQLPNIQCLFWWDWRCVNKHLFSYCAMKWVSICKSHLTQCTNIFQRPTRGDESCLGKNSFKTQDRLFPLHPCNMPPPFPLPTGNCYVILCICEPASFFVLVTSLLYFLDPTYIIQYLPSSVWIITLSIMPSKSIHVTANGKILLFLWLSSISLYECVYTPHLLYPFIINGHLNCFYTLAIVNNAINIGVAGI